jgi:hypothetical protein
MLILKFFLSLGLLCSLSTKAQIVDQDPEPTKTDNGSLIFIK